MTEDGWDAHRAQYLAGRLEGLAGTTRYDLTDEDPRDPEGSSHDASDRSE
jgi:hypothetical protein